MLAFRLKTVAKLLPINTLILAKVFVQFIQFPCDLGVQHVSLALEPGSRSSQAFCQIMRNHRLVNEHKKNLKIF